MAFFWLQVENLEAQWRKADKICQGTGGGVCDAALELKIFFEWNDDSPEWVCEKKVAFGPILKQCKYYFELEPIFAPRHGNTRLSVAHNLPPEPEDEDDSNPERQHDFLEHSSNSNLAYKDLQNENLDNNSQCDPLQQSLDLNLAHHEDHDSNILMESLEQIPSVDLTQTPSQGPTTTSVPLKRSATRNSSQSNSQSSTSQVQDLVQSQKLSCGSCVKPSNQIDDIISRQDAKFNCICHVADNIANLFPQAPKPVLDKEQEQKKASIELEKAKVVLEGEKKNLELYDLDLNVKQEHHKLEMQGKWDELEHQKTERHAQLIGSLMKEHNLTLQEAVSAAQSAAGIVSQQKS
ncbi:hypothetical protein DFH28DRAFT_1096405 [Melampsora americana]|nr:hypothetical protein DFH28DRAFT_1096405 [Melampsora americana]